MPNHNQIPQQDALAAYDAFVHNQGNFSHAAQSLGWSRNKLKRAYDAAIKRHGMADYREQREKLDAAFELPEIPDPEAPVEEIVRRMTDDYRRRREHHEATRLLKVKVNLDGPVGIMPFGDPHLPSPHTNWPRLTRDIDLTRQEGVLATNSGDTVDNWTGRMAEFHHHSSMSNGQERKIVEWFFNECQFFLVLLGNHDLWNKQGPLIEWLARRAGSVPAEWQSRVALQFPNGREYRINHAHGFKGSSIWNPGHGALREAYTGARDHLYFGGHIHTSWIAGPLVDPNTHEWAWTVQLGSYKDLPDAFGKRVAGNRVSQNAIPSVMVIVNPEAETPEGLTRVFADPEDGADVLAWMRKRHKENKGFVV